MFLKTKTIGISEKIVNNMGKKLAISPILIYLIKESLIEIDHMQFLGK